MKKFKPFINILGTNSYYGRSLELVLNATPRGFQFGMISKDPQQFSSLIIEDADYILAGGRLKITREILERAKHLKMIQRTGVGLDSIDLAAVKEMGIPLYVNKGVNAESVAEHTLMMMLCCLRRLYEIDSMTKKCLWERHEVGIETSELREKTVGIIGMGNISKALIPLLRPFHVNIYYYSRTRCPVEYENENQLIFTDLKKLLQKSDIVTIHCALTDKTKNMINAQAIGDMRDGAILINTARGDIVDPYALAHALRTKKISYAALDVHNQEPIKKDYPLRNLENVILTPHIAGITSESFQRMIQRAMYNIECFEEGRLSEIEEYRYF